jgi:hypothetical protein
MCMHVLTLQTEHLMQKIQIYLSPITELLLIHNDIRMYFDLLQN